MIQLQVLPLNDRSTGYLQQWQEKIDGLPTYEERVATGKAKFGSRNSNGNVTFRHVKEVLTKMCQGHKRCGYCEDSMADEVEHIKPKDLYPESVFSWDNYLYACGPCNGPKNNQFAVIVGQPDVLVDVTRAKDAPVVPPQAGLMALIDPRAEDPLHFLFLDLLNTFAFTPRSGITPVEKLRAEYTIKVLRLNSRDNLPAARRTAFETYHDRLAQYIVRKGELATQLELDRRRDGLLEVGHQTVWREMQRQHSLYQPLSALFAAAPEALQW